MSTHNRALGQQAERLAERYLLEQGARLLVRNFRVPFGEIDLLLEHEGELVAVEVKARALDDLEHPVEAVTHAQLRRIKSAMTAYATDTGKLELPWRIDVVAIRCEPDGTMPRLDHLRSVYPP